LILLEVTPNQRQIISIFALISSAHSSTSIPSEMIYQVAIEVSNNALDTHNAALKREVEKMEDEFDYSASEMLDKPLIKKNNWRLESEEAIGEGGHASVFLVARRNTKDELKEQSIERFALKAIKFKKIYNECVKSLDREINILKECDHPSLSKYITHFWSESKKVFYIVLKYYKGGSLLDSLKKNKRFEESEVKLYTAQIANAIGILHKKNIIHRDIKPNNVLIDENENLVLSDFGVSKVLSETRETSTHNIGTRLYWAPEMFDEEKKSYTMAVDWWSLGVTVYQLLFGEAPFTGGEKRNIYELMEQVRKAPVSFTSEKCKGISEQAKDFINALLCKNAEDRLGSKNDIREVLSHPFLEGIDLSNL